VLGWRYFFGSGWWAFDAIGSSWLERARRTIRPPLGATVFEIPVSDVDLYTEVCLS
jgi:hypothetical protein